MAASKIPPMPIYPDGVFPKAGPIAENGNGYWNSVAVAKHSRAAPRTSSAAHSRNNAEAERDDSSTAPHNAHSVSTSGALPKISPSR